MKKIFLFLSAMLISIISFAQNPLHEVTTETLNYTFLASEEAEATVEEIDDVVVYTISGLGSLNDEPAEFELFVNVMNNIEGMIGETFVKGEATGLFDEDGLLTVFGTAKDEAENTYTIEMSVEITEEEPTVEIVFTDTVDVTLYNFTLIPGKLPTTALDNIQVGNETMKVIRDGQLIIIKNDVEYNIQGAVVK